MYSNQGAHFDPSTYARNQQAHHAAVLQKVLDHNLSILPPLEPSFQSSTSSASNSSPSSAIFASPTQNQNAFGYPNLNPPIYSSQPIGVYAHDQVPLWDQQGTMKDFNPQTTQYPYDMSGTYLQIPQTHHHNPTDFINPGWLHDSQPKNLNAMPTPQRFIAPPNTFSSRPLSPLNPFDGTCYISAADNMATVDKSKKRRRSTSTKEGDTKSPYARTEDDHEAELVSITNSELLGTVGGRKDRRRTQNRLAQRAFRTRSKIQRAEAENHLRELEKQSESQAGRLSDLQSMVDKLQKENSSLKSASWDDARGSGALESYMSSIKMA